MGGSRVVYALATQNPPMGKTAVVHCSQLRSQFLEALGSAKPG